MCAAKCFIPNIVDLVEVYGRLCSLCSVLEMFYRTTQKAIGHWNVKIISIAAEGT